MNASTVKTRKTWLALLAIVAAFALALCMLSGCSSEKANDKTSDAVGENGKPILTVAMELAYPPFETKDEAGEAEGLSVDFMQDFADKYGYDLKIENTAWDGLIPSLQTDKADCVISSMTITDERKEAVDFSDPYAMAQLAILANANSGIEEASDLN